MRIRYAHTNVVARDWRALARFYIDVFGCEPVSGERDLRGPTVAAGVGREGSTIAGVHLKLPGYGPDGPTIEVFRYDPLHDVGEPDVRRPGWGHIAFQVDDVLAMRARVIAAGGRALGAVVTTPATGRRYTWCYVADPEGNPIELQRAWTCPDDVIVRPERESDRDAVRRCNTDAFSTPAEAALVDALREAGAPSRSWVAEREGDVVGHILVTAVLIDGATPSASWAIGPMSVAPSSQRLGVGVALLAEALHGLRCEGVERVFVLGHPGYYPRVGFELASSHGLRWEHGHDPAFFVLPLRHDVGEVSGVVRYHALFDGV